MFPSISTKYVYKAERDDLDLGNIQQSLALPWCEVVRSNFSITRRKV